MPTQHRKTVFHKSVFLFMYNPKGVAIVTSDEAIRYASLAQLAEHVTVNHGVVGSSPSRGAKKADRSLDLSAFFVFLHVLGSSAYP